MMYITAIDSETPVKGVVTFTIKSVTQRLRYLHVPRGAARVVSVIINRRPVHFERDVADWLAVEDLDGYQFFRMPPGSLKLVDDVAWIRDEFLSLTVEIPETTRFVSSLHGLAI